MYKLLYPALMLIMTIQSCGQEASRQAVLNRERTTRKDPGEMIQDKSTGRNSEQTGIKDSIINPEGMTIQTRFMPPRGTQRIITGQNSFADYLRKLPLKPHKSQVRYYNGNIKPNYDIYDAVINLEIGTKNLHQCADAIIRLRAEYLWSQKKYSRICFHFTNGFRADYSEWMKGKRIIVDGNTVYWVLKNNPSNTYQDFWKYLETVFMYAGTLSLSKELKTVITDSMRIGDVFIRGGSPGHAVIIFDMAVDNKTGQKFFLLAQSYMPAQEIQLLKNPDNETISPWYSPDPGQKLITPEWTFNMSDLKRFEE